MKTSTNRLALTCADTKVISQHRKFLNCNFITILLLIFTLFISKLTHANGVQLSSDGTGQVLLFPYYTVNGGFNTLLTLTNTRNQSKALRLRFREAANSREVFSANIYLGPYDVWTGAILKDDDSQRTKIISNDNSCTIPEINQSGVSFYNHQYIGNLADNYGEEILRLHEGFIEVIEMGVVTGNSAQATIIEQGSTSNCNSLVAAWENYWHFYPNIDLDIPTGGITGDVTLINVANGLAISEPVTALNGFSDKVLHFNYSNSSPNLADGVKVSLINNNGTPMTLEWSNGFEAVSSVLTKSNIYGEYVESASINANTDWVLTMPTRQYHINELNYEEPILPFSNEGGDNLISCERFIVDQVYSQDSESYITDQICTEGCVYPILPPGYHENIFREFCYASNNFSFTNNPDEEYIENNTFGLFDSNYTFSRTAFGSPRASNKLFFTPYESGNADISFTQISNRGESNGQQTTNIQGLPVIGFAIQSFANAYAQPGVRANYAGLFELKASTDIEVQNQDNDNGESQKPMQIENNGIGQVLIFPYYTVKNDLNTLISVVNTTNEVKAVKVRFLEGKNSRECLNFNLYLSAYDVWTAGLVADNATDLFAGSFYQGDESVKLITNDTSCTVPNINRYEFLPWGFDPNNDGSPPYDGGGRDLARCTEGHFEIIEMGTIIDTVNNRNAATAASHVDGVPQDCATLYGNWVPGSGNWAIIDPEDGVIDPDGTGGLFGSSSIIDVSTGIDLTYDAIAISNYSTLKQHYSPGLDQNLNLASGNNHMTLIQTEEELILSTWQAPIEAVSALFMQEQTSNDFIIDPNINAQSEWIINFPTKQFYVDPIYETSFQLSPLFQSEFTEYGACSDIKFMAHNREQVSNENDETEGIIGVPPPNYVPFENSQLCWSTNNIVINQENGNQASILGSQLLAIENNPLGLDGFGELRFTEGWMNIHFNQNVIQGNGVDGSTHKITGLPVIGLVAQRYKNGTINDGTILANYGVLSKNKRLKSLQVDL